MSAEDQNVYNCISLQVHPEDPEELKKFISLAGQVVDDYRKGVSGVKKRATAARKGLMEIKKLMTDMRKMALEKCKEARESTQ